MATLFLIAFGAGLVAGWLAAKIDADFASLEAARQRRAKVLAIKARIDEAMGWEGK